MMKIDIKKTGIVLSLLLSIFQTRLHAADADPFKSMKKTEKFILTDPVTGERIEEGNDSDASDNDDDNDGFILTHPVTGELIEKDSTSDRDRDETREDFFGKVSNPTKLEHLNFLIPILVGREDLFGEGVERFGDDKASLLKAFEKDFCESSCSCNKNNLLFTALVNRLPGVVKILLSTGVSVVDVDYYKKTPLDAAIQVGDLECLRLIRGANLFQAIKNNDPVRFQELLNAGADMFSLKIDGKNLLDTVLQKDKSIFVRMFLEQQPEVVYEPDRVGNTPFLVAAYRASSDKDKDWVSVLEALVDTELIQATTECNNSAVTNLLVNGRWVHGFGSIKPRPEAVQGALNIAEAKQLNPFTDDQAGSKHSCGYKLLKAGQKKEKNEQVVRVLRDKSIAKQ